MENKEVEKLLKESADDIKVKDFSERWTNISERINSVQRVEVKETVYETVSATTANTNVSQNLTRKKIVCSLCAVFLLIAVCLAIILPVTLNKKDTPKFFDSQDLMPVIVSESEFYNKIEETDLKIVDVKKYEAEGYTLLYAEDNSLVGGRFDVSDDDEGILASLVFYNSSVTSPFEIGGEYKTCAVSGFNIEYKTELKEDEVYSTKAKAVGADVRYEIECLSLNENIEDFFKEIFG